VVAQGDPSATASPNIELKLAPPTARATPWAMAEPTERFYDDSKEPPLKSARAKRLDTLRLAFTIFRWQDFKALTNNRSIEEAMRDPEAVRRRIAFGQCKVPTSVSINTADFRLGFTVDGGPSPFHPGSDHLSYTLAIQKALPDDRYIIKASGDGIIPLTWAHRYYVVFNRGSPPEYRFAFVLSQSHAK
jgi:hypothetical protein